MGLVRRVSWRSGLSRLADLRTQFDFEVSGLSAREQLVRLEYALDQALKQSNDPAAKDELEFALGECRTLLQLEAVQGEEADPAPLEQRLNRIRRIATYHEGTLSRFNRRYWWLVCSAALLMMAYCILWSALSQ